MAALLDCDSVSDFLDYRPMMARLRAMRARKQLNLMECTFWQRVRLHQRRSEWIKGREHWFGDASAIDRIAEVSLHRFVAAQRRSPTDRIYFEYDVGQLQPVPNQGWMVAQGLA